MVMKQGLFLIALILVFFSCKKKTVPASEYDVGQDYYPQTIGKYVIYDVDSTYYQEIPYKKFVLKYRIKEKIEEAYTDPQGKPALRLVRYIKKFDSTKIYDLIPWAVKDAWQVNVSNSNVEVVEENIRFTKLIFAVKTGVTWDGNLKNTLGEMLYSYNYMDTKETINSVVLEKVLLVKQKDFRTAISYQYYIEKYARGVGLVYREYKDLYSGTVVSGVLVENRTDVTGKIYKLTIVSYGNE